MEKFGTDFAYTMDGGECGELDYENFNAASAFITFHGVSIHPGSAKNKMVNAILLAMEFQGMLPQNQKPEYTQDREGFLHLDTIQGSVEEQFPNILSATMIWNCLRKRSASWKELLPI